MSRISRAVFRTALLALDIGPLLAFPNECPAQVHGAHYLTVEEMRAKLDTMEHIAVTAAGFERRISAVSAIAAAGAMGPPPGEAPPPPYPGIVERLRRVYRQNADNSPIRHAILGVMRTQFERVEALGFLGEVAQESPPPEATGVMRNETFPLPWEAIEALSRMGPEGSAALQRLHADGTVHEPAARRHLEQMAREGFPARRGN